MNSPPAVGDAWNGYVWNGAAWVPRVDGPGRVFDGERWGGARKISGAQGSAVAHSSSGFTNPHYGYGLTRQTSDDLQFIVRYVKITIIVGLVLAGLSVIPLVLFLLSLLALGSR